MTTRKSINVILDLDNTLICAVDDREEAAIGPAGMNRRMSRLNWKDMEGSYKIFERPHLQEFLTWLFAQFNVSVWTAASKSYALFVVNEFVIAGRTNRRLDYLLFSHHCRRSKRTVKSQKALTMLADVFPVNYDVDRTFIVDDHVDVYSAQPHRCIKIKRFDVSRSSCESDVELDRVMKKLDLIRIRLE